MAPLAGCGVAAGSGTTYKHADDVEYEDADVHAADGAGDVLGGVARLRGGHSEDFGTEL